ncbi:MAG TPA: hypothetical protein VM820_12670 [Vicinamibacterales bacterium]|nr:hypothetical protein [Vicinamibacterales bacterium]
MSQLSRGRRLLCQGLTAAGDGEAELRRDDGWEFTVPRRAGAPDGQLVAVRRCLY